MASSPAVFSIINTISRIDGILIIVMINFFCSFCFELFLGNSAYKINFNGIQSSIPTLNSFSMIMTFYLNDMMIW